jgi:hypothetical protein
MAGRELEEEFRRHRRAIVKLGRRRQPFFVTAEVCCPRAAHRFLVSPLAKVVLCFSYIVLSSYDARIEYATLSVQCGALHLESAERLMSKGRVIVVSTLSRFSSRCALLRGVSHIPLLV